MRAVADPAGDFAPGLVWLVGAGPGDPDLLTRQAERLLRGADAVFVDALVGPGVRALIAPTVEQIAVGKRSGRHSRGQAEINAMLIAAAQSGRKVVRLKGGDPSIFGRSSEEIAALCAAGLRVRVCPGVTTACAAAARAGLSLTLRGLARQLTFVTAHAEAGRPLALDWSGLAQREQSLAIYMGRSAAGQIARSLIAAGRAKDTPAIVACNVSLSDELLIHTRLDALAFAVKAVSGSAPTLLLVGEAFADPAVATAPAGERVAA